jgi:LPS O-antigen subunit length determinant protein (WzzB/FepE family)
LSAAKETTFNNIRAQHNTVLELKISQLERADLLQKQILKDRIEARTEFVLNKRQASLEELENALKIARANGILNPVNTNIGIPDENSLYQRGTKLLTTDIEYLKSLNDNVSTDKEILTLKKETLLLKNNRLVEQLKSTLITENKSDGQLFYDTKPNVQAIPEKSKKLLIIIVSILLGGMFGVFIAIGRIILRSYKKAKLNAA